ncbi:MAG TPA: DUF2971 domain-containing protein [Rhizomicrobium sp.]|nr:DUF2971 domain-containing protein [Rhizomicrobium sp.]
MAIPGDMLAALEACYQECEARVNAYAASLESQPPPSTIYHYTDGVGLSGILESGKIRLTDIFDLNDPTELRHGVRHASEILDARAPQVHTAGKLFAQDFKILVSEGATKIADFYVACFSAVGDDLGQWRAYANNGRGFALGFDGKSLETAYAHHTVDEKSGCTFPVSYDEKLLRDIQNDLVCRIVPLIASPEGRGLAAADLNDYMKELSISLSVPTIRAALFFKHPAYLNEQEYRFLELRSINAKKDDVKSKVRGYSTIRYLEFDWKKSAASSLKEIVVGPAAPFEEAKEFAERCLDLFEPKIGSVQIRKSDIPYRAA